MVREVPLARKLGIKPGHRVVFMRAPDGFASTIGRLDGVDVLKRATVNLDVVVLFCDRVSDLERSFPGAKRALALAGGLWVAYPKKSSGRPTDLTFENVQRLGLCAGLVDNKSCAIDDVWTALRFVYRLVDR